MIHDDLLVCIVDDDVSAREAMVGLVRSAGLVAEGFSSAKEYLGAPRSAPPACFVLDIDMPGLSGLDLQQQLLHAEAIVPIVFVTGHADIPMSVRALKAGAMDFLTKPSTPSYF